MKIRNEGDAVVARRWARLRFSIIGPLLAAPPEHGELQEQLGALAAKAYQHPTTDEVVRFGASTIERWFYAARGAADPVLTLARKVPSHAGTYPSMPARLAAVLEAQYRAASPRTPGPQPRSYALCSKGRQIGKPSELFFGSWPTRDGRYVTWTRGGAVRIWDPASGEVSLALDVPRPAGFVAVHPDGIRLAIVDGTPRVAIWNIVSGEVQTLSTEVDMWAFAAFSPDGRWLASAGGDGRVRLFDLERGTDRLLRGPTPGQLTSVVFAPDSRRFATAGGDAIVWVWDVETGRPRALVGHDKEAREVEFSADSTQLFSISADHTVRVWDLATGTSQQWLGHTGPLVTLARSPDGRWLATCDEQGGLRMWEVATGQVRVLAGHGDGIMALAFSLDGKWLASGSKDDTARIWAVDQEEHRALVGHDEVVRQARFSRDGRWLATVDGNDAVWHWDPATGRGTHSATIPRARDGLTFLADDATVAIVTDPVRTISPDGTVGELAPASTGARPISVDLTADGALLIADADGKVQAYRAGALTPFLEHGAPIDALVELSDGRIVTAGRDRVLRIWVAGQSTPATEHPFGPTDGLVIAIDQHAGGIKVVTADRLGIAMTELATGARVELPGVPSFGEGRFSPDKEQFLIADREGVVHLWTPETGAELQIAHENVMYSIFSGDGTRIFSCGEDGTLRTWTLDGVLLGMHRAGNACFDLALSRDGSTLAVADYDHVVRLWSTSGPLLPESDAELHAYLATLTSVVVLPGDEIGTPP